MELPSCPDLPFKVHPVTEEDLCSVLDVYRKCEDYLTLGPQSLATLEMVRADLQHSRETGGIFCGIFLSTEKGVQMAGILDYIPASFEGRPEAAFISLLMIAPAYRSAGLGSSVISFIEEQIRRNSSVNCVLSAVQVNNPAATRFWQRQGYQLCSPALPQEDGTVVYMLVKKLYPLGEVQQAIR
jgi:ribosomal protein S18 acetylase RimI-like enzyme